MPAFDRREACRTLAVLLVAGALPAPARAAFNVEIIAPAHLGDSLDQVARALAEGLNQFDGSVTASVTDAPGQGGFAGLERFVNAPKTKLMMLAVSLGTLGATTLAKRALTLDDTIAVHRLCGEHLVLVVPERSPIQNLEGFAELMRRAPDQGTIAGREIGSASHLLCLDLARAVGVPARGLRYSGIEEPGALFRALMTGKVAAVAGGLSSFAQQLKGGSVRALAVSSPERIAGFAAPTFKEAGFPIELADWRGVMAPGSMDPALIAQFAQTLAAMLASPYWREGLERRHWLAMPQTGDAFASFLRAERERVTAAYTAAGLL